MLRKVIDLNYVEIWKFPDTYKKELNFDLLVVQTSHSLHKVAIREVWLRITKHIEYISNS